MDMYVLCVLSRWWILSNISLHRCGLQSLPLLWTTSLLRLPVTLWSGNRLCKTSWPRCRGPTTSCRYVPTLTLCFFLHFVFFLCLDVFLNLIYNDDLKQWFLVFFAYYLNSWGGGGGSASLLWTDVLLSFTSFCRTPCWSLMARLWIQPSSQPSPWSLDRRLTCSSWDALQVSAAQCLVTQIRFQHIISSHLIMRLNIFADFFFPSEPLRVQTSSDEFGVRTGIRTGE